MGKPEVGISREQFLQDYGEAIAHGYAAVFAGAGLSKGSGYSDWKGLLKEFAEELGLDLEIETDLVAVAQYHITASEQKRNRLHQKLVDEFSTAVQLSPAHRILAELPIRTYWTSNYDDLVEAALKDAKRKIDVKRSSAALPLTGKDADAIVYKLHGDLGDPETIIITRDDYEEYERKFPGFFTQLRADLTSKTFLFVGFSFSDPHLDFILTQLKRDFGEHMRRHFAILRRESRSGRTKKQYEYALNRQRLRVRDLQRYNISTLLIDDYDEIPEVLRLLRLRYLRRQVFVSGAAHDFSPRGETWIEEFAFNFGKALIDRGYNLVSGLGVDVGRSVMSGALDELYRQVDPRIDQRLLLRPFPTQKAAYTKHRELMLATVGFAVFISGNKLDGSGNAVESAGVIEEYELARRADVYPLPVGSTGWAAARLWQQVHEEFVSIFPPGTPEPAFDVLNDARASTDQVIKALFDLMQFVQPASK